MAVIEFDLEAVFWLDGPLVASMAVLVTGLILKNRSRGAAPVLLLVGTCGVLLSAAWIASAFYVDAVIE
jgi:hypothetical protein